MTQAIHAAMGEALKAVQRELIESGADEADTLRASMMAMAGVTSALWHASAEVSGISGVETLGLLQHVIGGQFGRLMEDGATPS